MKENSDVPKKNKARGFFNSRPLSLREYFTLPVYRPDASIRPKETQEPKKLSLREYIGLLMPDGYWETQKRGDIGTLPNIDDLAALAKSIKVGVLNLWRKITK